MTERVVSFCFDDGFRRSADKVRRIFDSFGVSACFCVLSAPELADDPGIRGAEIASWAYWRETLASGHEVAPHGHTHEFYGHLDAATAQASIEACWRTFEQELTGFDHTQSVFHVPYLSAPAQLVRWISKQSLGARLATGNKGLNELGGAYRDEIDCVCFGPDRVGASALDRLKQFDQETGWLVLVLHGVDDEGWGPIIGRDLEALVDRVLTSGAEIIPPNRYLLG